MIITVSSKSELQHYLCFSDKVFHSQKAITPYHKQNKYRVNMHFSVSMGCLTVRGTDKTELVTITLGFFQSS